MDVIKRIIKFRAWDKSRKRMIFGPTDGNVSSAWVFTMAEAGGAYDDVLVLMQSTGLLDRGGKEIYEGDVLKEGSPDIGPYYVVFENGSFVCFHKSGKWGLLSRAFEIDMFRFQVEVIGNVYQNPELFAAIEGEFRL